MSNEDSFLRADRKAKSFLEFMQSFGIKAEMTESDDCVDASVTFPERDDFHVSFPVFGGGFVIGIEREEEGDTVFYFIPAKTFAEIKDKYLNFALDKTKSF